MCVKHDVVVEPVVGEWIKVVDERIKVVGERSSDAQVSWEQQFAQFENGWEQSPEASSYPASGGDSIVLDARTGAHSRVSAIDDRNGEQLQKITR